MTLEEKVGQLVQYSAGQPTGPGTGRTDYDDMIRKGEVGALFNITTARQVNAYQHIAVEQSRLHIPLLFGLDVIHGFRTRSEEHTSELQSQSNLVCRLLLEKKR